MEKKNTKKKGVSSLLFGVFAFIVIAIFAILSYFYYSTQKELKDLKNEVSILKGENVEDNSGDNTINNTNTKCSNLDGKYYGELIDDNLYMRQTYVFSSDGSYTTWVENGGVTSGYYIVSNGSIYFFQKPELGPSDALNNYYFDISDDCNSITAYAGLDQYTLNKVE